MRTCPFHDCGRPIPVDKFACAKHWRALSPADRRAVNAIYGDYLAGRIGVDELRKRQQQVLGDRGTTTTEAK